MYFCICHETIFLHLDVWTPMSWKQVVQNSWLHSTLQRVTQALMRREPMGFFNREVAKHSSKARRSLNAHWLSQEQRDNLCTLQSRQEKKLRAGSEFTANTLQKILFIEDPFFNPCSIRVLCTYVPRSSKSMHPSYHCVAGQVCTWKSSGTHPEEGSSSFWGVRAGPWVICRGHCSEIICGSLIFLITHKSSLLPSGQ